MNSRSYPLFNKRGTVNERVSFFCVRGECMIPEIDNLHCDYVGTLSRNLRVVAREVHAACALGPALVRPFLQAQRFYVDISQGPGWSRSWVTLSSQRSIKLPHGQNQAAAVKLEVVTDWLKGQLTTRLTPQLHRVRQREPLGSIDYGITFPVSAYPDELHSDFFLSHELFQFLALLDLPLDARDEWALPSVLHRQNQQRVDRPESADE